MSAVVAMAAVTGMRARGHRCGCRLNLRRAENAGAAGRGAFRVARGGRAGEAAGLGVDDDGRCNRNGKNKEC